MSNSLRRTILAGTLACLLLMVGSARAQLSSDSGNSTDSGGIQTSALGSSTMGAEPFGDAGSMLAPPTPKADPTIKAIMPATQPTPTAMPTPLAPPTPKATTQPSASPTGLGSPLSRASLPLILTAMVAAPDAAGTKSSAVTKPAATAKPADTRRDFRSTSSSSDPRTERLARIQTAVEHHQGSQQLDDFKIARVDCVFTRPHPILSTWGSDMAVDTLQRMLQPFTDNEFRDTYIRWHLMEVVKKATLADRKSTGPMLVQLIKMMPGPLAAKGRDAYHWEPADIAAKYFSVCYAGQMWVGYPPFVRLIDAPESYKYMTADQAASAKAKLEEAAALLPKIHRVDDPGALAWNERIIQINYLIREYRGELIYSLLLTGDASTAKLVMNEVDRQVRLKNGIGFDLLAYVYLAAFDKALNLYDQKTLNELSAILEGTARAADEWVDYGGQKRNFAQYAFHLVYMLKDGGGFIDAKEDEFSATSTRRRH